ncbi:MAG: NAD(P)/FAD-dependent oxidoreductase, partial [Promethearchaeota archaeon]
DEEAFYFRAALKYFIKNTITKIQLKGRVADFWKDRKIQRIMDTVKLIDKNEQFVEISDGVRIPYIKLLIATGGSPFLPSISGIHLQNVHPMRSIRDTQEICNIIDKGRWKHCVILGAGVLGMELAEALLHRQISVDILTNSQNLIPRMLDSKASKIIRKISESKGLTIHFQDSIQSIQSNKLNQEGQEQPENQEPGSGFANQVITTSGKTIQCDGVFICTGMTRDISLTIKIDLPTNRGVLVDGFLQTSDPHIFAAGDVVEIKNSSEKTSQLVELWGPAGKMGKIAAMNMLGRKSPYSLQSIHAYTMLWKHSIHSIGIFNPEDGAKEKYIIQSNQDTVGGTSNYFKLVFLDNRIVGCLMVGQARDPLLLEHIINHNIKIPPEILNDEIMEREFDFERILYSLQ